MKYTVTEKTPEGNAYVVIERDDGSTYGQMVSMAGIASAADLDERVAALHADAEARNQPQAGNVLLVDSLLNAKRSIDALVPPIAAKPPSAG